MAGEEKQDRAEIERENRQAVEASASGDQETTLEPRARELEPPAPKEEPKEPKVGTRFDEKRQKISQMAREMRANKPEIEGTDDMVRGRMGDNLNYRSDEPKPPARPGGPLPPSEPREQQRQPAPKVEQPAPRQEVQPAPADEPKRTLRVYGEDREYTQSEIDALAREAAAAGNLLDQVKSQREQNQQLFDRLNQIAERINVEPASKSETPPAPGAKPETPPDKATLDEVIERIQVGTTEEAAAALAEFGDDIQNRLLERIGNLDDRIATSIETSKTRERAQEEMRSTLNDFGEKFPEFKGDAAMQSALTTETQRVMREDLEKIGVQDGSIRELASQQQIPYEQAITRAYAMLRARPEHAGHLADNMTVLTRSATNLRTRFGYQSPNPTPAPAPPTNETGMQNREERKRVLSSQPRRSAGQHAERTEQTRESKQLEAIRARKAARVR